MTRTGRQKLVTVLVALAVGCTLAAIPTGASAADVEVRARVDRNILSVNDQLTLTIEVQGTMRQVPTPKLPDLESSFSVYSAGSSTNMSWVNGAMTSSRSWTYRLLPKGTGTFTIGAAEVDFDGSVYATDPIEVEVVEGDAPRQTSEREERASSGVQSSGRDIFITTSVNKRSAYVGEQVTLSFKFYRRVDLWEQPRYEAPDLTGFWVTDIPDREEYYETVDGIRYVVIEIKTALFGTSPGTATVGRAALTYRERAAAVTFFQRAGPTRTVQTDPIEVEIKPLPREGKPAGFGGAVGRYDVTTSLETSEVDQWKPVTLTVSISGTGNLRSVPDPELPELPEFKVYESGTSTNTSTANAVVSGRKTYEYVLVPQTAGTRTIPAIELAYFDPRTKEYRTSAAPALSLEVAPAEEGEGSVDLPARAAISRLGRDVRYIHEPEGVLQEAGPPVHARTSFALLQLLPLAALAGAVALRRRRDMFASEDGLERFVRAPGTARKELKLAREALARGEAAGVCSSVSKALVDFTGSRLKVGARGMTLPELSGVLRSAGAGDELTERVTRLLSECDLGRFAAGTGSVESERLVAEAEACLRELERLSARRRR